MTGLYQNFDIRVLRTGVPRRYQLIIQYPGVQPESGHVIECELPPSYADLLVAAPPDRQRRWRKSTTDLLNEQNLVCYAADIEALKEIGDRLFQSVLQGELAGEYGVVADRVARDGGLLRLRINLTNAPELSREPWEALYRKRNEVLLAIHAATPVVRLLDSPTAPDITPIEPPVRLLVVSAVPGQDLDVSKELANIDRRTDRLLEAERAVPFKVEVLGAATRTSLHEAVRNFEPHILHYIGHGSFGKGTGWIHLHSQKDPTQIDHVDAETLRDMLANARPKLVVLNTCEGGMASEIDSFSGMAHALIQRNIPYVVAMQYPISDDAAVTFSDMLYSDLARGKPIDVAVTSARNAIRLLEDPALQVELITPVLYTSGSIDRLIEPSPADGGAQVAPAPAFDEMIAPALSARPRKLLWLVGGGAAVILALGMGALSLGIGDSFGDVASSVDQPQPIDDLAENAADDLLAGADENALAEMLPDPADDEAIPRSDGVLYERELGSSGGAGAPVIGSPRPRRAPRRAARPPVARSAPPDRVPAPIVVEPPRNPAPSAALSTRVCRGGIGRLPTGGCPAPTPPVIEQPGRTGGTSSPPAYHPESSPIYSGVLGNILGSLGSIRPILPETTWVDRDQDGRVDGYLLNGEYHPGVPSLSVVAPERDASPAPLDTVTMIGADEVDASVADLRESAAFQAAASDPQLVISVVGRGGRIWQQRVELAHSIASKLVSEVPPGRVIVDAVANDRDLAEETVEAEVSYRVSGAAQLRFALDSHAVAANEIAKLKSVADWLTRHPGANVILQAHTDSSGPSDYNLELAERRADAIGEILTGLGVTEGRIAVQAVGEGMAAPGASSGPADDRRVELMIAPGAPPND